MLFLTQLTKSFRKIRAIVLAGFLLLSVLSAAQERKVSTSIRRLTPQNAADLLLTKRGFSLGYSFQNRQALFVGYILNAENLKKNVRRSNVFQADPEITENPVQPKDYRRTGYDKGHLAPAADMAWSKKSMQESFYMSNITPQLPGCNRGIWKRLEMQLRSLVGPNDRFCVVTGPIFSEDPAFLGDSGIPIPCAFYKVVLDLNPPCKAIGFLIPNAPTKKGLRSFACTVDQVEAVTMLDFFSILPDAQENELESQCAPEQWGL